MYIQITTRCNMECTHCCYACTSEGEDMSLEMFKKCLEFEVFPRLGGGEPTIHPQFETFLLLAMGGCDHVWLATNGKKKETALMLAGLAESGIISCELSLDPWHEKIDREVIAAFYKDQDLMFGDKDYRAIRDVSHNQYGSPINSGRCDFGVDDACVCAVTFVKPNGDVHQCGCLNSPKLGNIMIEFELPDRVGCYKNLEGEEE